jgi:predicted transcriptional regulator
MKTFTFKYDPNPQKTTFDNMKRSMLTGEINIQKDSIYCSSAEDMIKVMTKSRFEIFTTIVEKAPESLTLLAKVLDKDLGNVHRDAKVLETLGLIKLKRSPGKRGSKLKPIALYDRIIFECEPKRAVGASNR